MSRLSELIETANGPGSVTETARGLSNTGVYQYKTPKGLAQQNLQQLLVNAAPEIAEVLDAHHALLEEPVNVDRRLRLQWWLGALDKKLSGEG